MKFTILFSAALVACVLSARATTQSTAMPLTNSDPEAAMTALFGDPVVVKAKGFEIKRSELDPMVSGAKANAEASGQGNVPEIPALVLDKLITIHMLMQVATAADKAAGQADADKQYTNLLAKFTSQDAFDRQLKMMGMTRDQLRAKAAEEATAQVALKREVNATATADEVKKLYDDHSAKFELPERIQARHILLMTIDPNTRLPLSTNTVAEKRKQIEDIHKQLLAGADFATLAKQYSEDPGSKANGGELPVFTRGQMVPEFEAAAFALKTNEISDVVTSPFGFHLIKLLDKIPAKKFGFTDPIPEADGLTPEQICRTQLESQKINRLAPDYLKKLRADQQVDIVDANLKQLDAQVEAKEAAAAAAATDDSLPPTNK